MVSLSTWILCTLVCGADTRDLKVEVSVHSTAIRYGDPIYARLTVTNGGMEVQKLPKPLCAARTQKYELRQDFLTWTWRFGGGTGVASWNVGKDQSIGSLTSLDVPVIEYSNHDFWRGGKYELTGTYFSDYDHFKRCENPVEIRISPRTAEEWDSMREIERLLHQIAGEEHFHNRHVPVAVIRWLENPVKQISAGSYRNNVTGLIYSYKLAAETNDQSREQQFADYLKWLDSLHPFERHVLAQGGLHLLMHYNFSNPLLLDALLDRVRQDETWVNGQADRESYQQSLREYRSRIGKPAAPR